MRAGKLRYRITIQNYTITNTQGEIAKTWATFATVWADIEPLKGREYFESAIEEAEVSAKITMRYKSGVKPQMRVLHDSVYYDIVSVIHSGLREREMVLMVNENVI